MTDDIVTRLRESKEVNGFDSLGGGYRHLTIVTPAPVCAEAADEIERLRELADNLYKTLLYYPCQCGISPCKCGYDDMMDEYKEVRGD